MNPQVTNFINLVQRSKDVGDGWRKVSDILYKGLVEKFAEPELIEKKTTSDGYFVRLSEKGKIVAEFM